MSKLMEDRVTDTKIQIAVNLLAMGDLSYEKIANATGLTVSDIEDIAKQLESSEVQ